MKILLTISLLLTIFSQGVLHLQTYKAEHSILMEIGEKIEAEKEKKKDDKAVQTLDRNLPVIIKASSFPFAVIHLKSHPEIDNLTPPPDLLNHC